MDPRSGSVELTGFALAHAAWAELAQAGSPDAQDDGVGSPVPWRPSIRPCCA